jgi:Ca2+-binding RTX toxin-like protein
MAKVEGTDGSDTIGARNGATDLKDTIFGKGGPDTIHGLGGSDFINGGDGNDKIYGGDHEDYLFGEDGDDLLSGDDGNDFMRGGAGADTLDGGAGHDLVCYSGSPSGVYVSLMAGKGSGGDATGDQLIGIEGVYGSEHADTILGDDAGNTLSGEGGSDTVKGYGGEDYIWGGSEADTLYGMDGNDLIHGGAGKDYISGGAGRDSLFGDAGADTFAWSSAAEAQVDGASFNACNTDVIVDFDPDEFDLIDLSGIDADVYTPGNQAFTFIGATAFSGAPGELGYVHFCGDTYILMQTGTVTDVEGVIRIPGTVIPNAGWFEL